MDVLGAAARIAGVVRNTPLQLNAALSARYGCSVFLKREDLQLTRSYKIRGALNFLSSQTSHPTIGYATASAGNHAQGFAYSCRRLGTRGSIFMPAITPKQKVVATARHGGDSVDIVLVGDTFDDCAAAAAAHVAATGAVFVPPFDHSRIIEGQATIGLEIVSALPDVDAVILPVGGGGLAAGVGSFLKAMRPQVLVYGVEPAGAPSMTEALTAGAPVTLQSIDRFVDGAAVKRVGGLTFEVCQRVLDGMTLVPEGRVCTTILDLYNTEAIVVEPAGALSIAALEELSPQLAGKKVVCVVSGSNNDIERMAEIKERSLIYEGLKHYFLIRFAQRPGALREFVSQALGPGDDISRFEYLKKTARESGPALVGIELSERGGYQELLSRMTKLGIQYTEVNKDEALFAYLV